MAILRTAPVEQARTRLGVLLAHGEMRVLAMQAFKAGQVVDTLRGMIKKRPTRYTLQVGWNQHLDVAKDATHERIMSEHPWQFLNHSCEPSVRVQGRDLVAIRAIKAFEELSFDYETTEWDMASPFTCRCGACEGRVVRGFRWLSADERVRRLGALAPHLKERLELVEA
ncbi:MAG: SET domain-containing protein-lysine N-methyltransferase [Planctomycetia bacterium]|jgi:hypothetical protein